MRAVILISIFFGVSISLCQGQQRILIINETDSAIGRLDTIRSTGGISKFIISQAKITPLNKIYFDGSVYIDDADVDSIYCRRTFFRNFIIKKCKLKSACVFDSVACVSLQVDSNIFQSDLRINSRFNNENGTFSEIGDFSFSRNKVYGKTTIVASTFRSLKCDFTTFQNVVTFEECNLNSTSFYGVNFEDSLVFNGTAIPGANFTSSTFKKTFSLTSIARGRIIFDSCHFNKGLILSTSFYPNTSLSFKDIILPDTLDLSNNPVINNAIDLTNVQFHDGKYKCIIFLYKTDISKIQLDYKFFKLGFRTFEGHEVSKTEKEAIYEALLKNFKEHFQNESYELLDIEYRDFKNGWFILPHYWNCYGYHKEWIFWWTISMLAVFTFITFFLIDKLTRFVYKINYIPNLSSFRQMYRRKNWQLFFRRLWLSLAYTATIFFLFLLKVENIKFKNWKGVLYLVLMYATGLVCIAYMANFILQK